MEATPCLGGQVNYELTQALCVYKSTQGSILTSHAINVVEGKQQLGPASLISKEALNAILNDAKGISQDRYLLPANVICWESEVLVWHLPSQRRTLYMKEQGSGNKEVKRREVVHPPLLFRADNRGLSVWVMKEDGRPTKKTQLYFAPYYNIYNTGRMCSGSVRLPQTPSPDKIDVYEEGFFRSDFTHPNLDQSLTKHPGGIVGLWNDLEKADVWNPATHGKWLREVTISIAEVLTENSKKNQNGNQNDEE